MKTFILFKADIKKNEEILSALEQIGDSKTLPVLEKLISPLVRLFLLKFSILTAAISTDIVRRNGQ